jgi:hypothetical protein
LRRRVGCVRRCECRRCGGRRFAPNSAHVADGRGGCSAGRRRGGRLVVDDDCHRDRLDHWIGRVCRRCGRCRGVVAAASSCFSCCLTIVSRNRRLAPMPGLGRDRRPAPAHSDLPRPVANPDWDWPGSGRWPSCCLAPKACCCWKGAGPSCWDLPAVGSSGPVTFARAPYCRRPFRRARFRIVIRLEAAALLPRRAACRHWGGGRRWIRLRAGLLLRGHGIEQGGKRLGVCLLRRWHRGWPLL